MIQEDKGEGPVVGLAGSFDCLVAKGLSLLPEETLEEATSVYIHFMSIL